MTTATMRLIEAVERLNMTGEIGDGMVATLHDLASAARIEVTPHLGFLKWSSEQAREAMDASTLGGRSRIDEARAQLTAAREGVEQQRNAPADKRWICVGRQHGGWRCYSRCLYEYQCEGSGCGGETLAKA